MKRPKATRRTAAKPSAKRTGAKGIRKLALDEDLGSIFAEPDREEALSGFAGALAEQALAKANILAALREKGEADPAGDSPQARIKRSTPQEELDLHGCTAMQAQLKTENFLARAKSLRLKTVLVITGKGLHSPDGPVLKDAIESQLRALKNENKIIAYLWDKKEKERSGGLLVFLP